MTTSVTNHHDNQCHKSPCQSVSQIIMTISVTNHHDNKCHNSPWQPVSQITMSVSVTNHHDNQCHTSPWQPVSQIDLLFHFSTWVIFVTVFTLIVLCIIIILHSVYTFYHSIEMYLSENKFMLCYVYVCRSWKIPGGPHSHVQQRGSLPVWSSSSPPLCSSRHFRNTQPLTLGNTYISLLDKQKVWIFIESMQYKQKEISRSVIARNKSDCEFIWIHSTKDDMLSWILASCTQYEWAVLFVN